MTKDFYRGYNSGLSAIEEQVNELLQNPEKAELVNSQEVIDALEQIIIYTHKAKKQSIEYMSKYCKTEQQSHPISEF